MFSRVVRVVDQDILVETDFDTQDGRLSLEDGESPSLRIRYYSTPVANSFAVGFRPPYETLVMTYQSPGRIYSELEQMLALMTGLHSPQVDSIQGAGVAIKTGLRRNEKGVLLVGPAGSGKSTLLDVLGGVPLDDEVLMVSSSAMYTATTWGFVTRNEINDGDERKMRVAPEKVYRAAPISAAFLLDRSLPGGQLQNVDSQIPRGIAAFDALPERALIPYLTMQPIQVNSPVYSLGTGGNPMLAVNAIKKVL